MWLKIFKFANNVKIMTQSLIFKRFTWLTAGFLCLMVICSDFFVSKSPETAGVHQQANSQPHQPSQPATRLESRPDSQPATRPVSRFAIQSEYQFSTRWESRIITQSAIRPASELATKPASQTVTRSPLAAPVQANDAISKLVGAYDARNGGLLQTALDGSGVTIGIFDLGKPLESHIEFDTRVTYVDAESASVDNHATQMTGTVAASGNNTSARGLAPSSEVKAWNFNNDLTKMTAAASDGLRISMHPYFYPGGWTLENKDPVTAPDANWTWLGSELIDANEDIIFGYYHSMASNWDDLAHTHQQYLIVKVAGNQRGKGPASQPIAHWYYDEDPEVNAYVLATEEDAISRELGGGTNGFDSMSFASLAKNVLTVGNVTVDENLYSGSASVQIGSGSGWGPTDDGRIKPDLVAPSNITTTTGSASSSDYTASGGTSAATAVTTGVAALILQQYRQMFDKDPLSSTYKALMVQTADEAGLFDGPDYAYGWGLLNASQAIQYLTAATNSQKVLHAEAALANAQTHTYYIESNGLTDFQVTIAWVDPPGESLAYGASAMNNRSALLVNDLDVRVVGPDATTHFPWLLDPENPANAATKGDNIVDNVEQIRIGSPDAGQYTITVSHKGTLVDGPQSYSIFAGPAQIHTRKYAIDSSGWRLVSSPFSGMSYAALNEAFFTQGGPSSTWATYQGTSSNLLKYVNPYDDESLEIAQFVPVDGAGGAFSSGHGYLFYMFDANPPGFPEREYLPAIWVNSGNEPENIDIPLEGAADELTYFLAGNPYTESIDWRDVYAASDNFAPGIAVWNPDGIAKGGIADYVYYSAELDIGDAEPFIAPGTGFFAQLTYNESETVAGTLRFRRDHIARYVAPTFYGKQINLGDNHASQQTSAKNDNLTNTQTPAQNVKFELFTDSFVSAEARIVWHDAALHGFDNLDIVRVEALVTNELLVDFIVDNRTLAFDVRPPDTSIYEIRTCAINPGDYSLRTTGDVREFIMKSAQNTQLVHKYATGEQVQIRIETPSGGLFCETWLMEVSNGTQHVSIVNPSVELPLALTLSQNFPNPFNPVTQIRFVVPWQNQVVYLAVYNLLGQKIAVLVDKELARGEHQVTFSSLGLSSGIYIYRLRVGDQFLERKMTIIK